MTERDRAEKRENSLFMRVIDKHERARETSRQTDRQTDRETERERQRLRQKRQIQWGGGGEAMFPFDFCVFVQFCF